MINNTQLLHELLRQNKIRMAPGYCLDQAPQALPAGFDFDRVEGMLLGLAIGDALGNTTESRNPDERLARHGEIRDYLPNRHAGGKCIGLPSDDSQMAFWTLETLIADGGLIPDHLAQRFSRQEIFGIGSTVKGFLRAYKDRGVSWQDAGQNSAGNGAIMRIAPVLLPHLCNPSPALWADAALAGMITHNDRASNASCVAYTYLLWEALRLKQPPQPEWWLDTFVSFAGQVEGDSSLQPRVTGMNYQGPLWKFTAEKVRWALERGMSVLDACNHWHSGAYLLETVPSVLYILCRHGQNPEEAIIRAVNDTRDNDTVAAIVGAAVGALHGKRGLPERWIQGLSGRMGAHDDGKIFDLIQQAKAAFWETGAGATIGSTPQISALERYRGCLLGLAAGDAVGTVVEFCSPGTFSPVTDMTGGGPFRLAAGQWTDDTSMALCLAESLVECNGCDPEDQMNRYLRWMTEGYLSSNGVCFDIGNTVRQALLTFQRTGNPYSGPTGPYSAGNGSLMRIAPVAMYYANAPELALSRAVDCSRTTHGARQAVDACRYFVALLVGALKGIKKDELLSDHFCPIPDYWSKYPLAPAIAEIAGGSFKVRQPPEIIGSGYVVKSLEAALWAFYHSENFRQGCLLATNLGNDADTTAAIYGQIAGAYYGESGIPVEWRKKLAKYELIVSLADRLYKGAAT